MTEDRRKELALLVVEDLVMQRGMPNPQQLRQDVGNVAKRLGEGATNTQELLDFYETFVPKLYGQTFGYQSVSINASSTTRHR